MRKLFTDETGVCSLEVGAEAYQKLTLHNLDQAGHDKCVHQDDLLLACVAIKLFEINRHFLEMQNLQKLPV